MAYRGSCPDMCPESERQTRFGLYMSVFEKDHNNQPDERAMVKEYRRSGADQEEPASEDLRTPQALELTMDYLVCNILDDSRSKSPELALEWYDFLWDRFRAIRKDITQQNICDKASTILVERCARFHVHSCYAMNRVKNFDVDMNKRNLNDCLQMLRQMYHDLKMTGLQCPGELEFQKYDILLHLNEDHLSSIVLMKTSDFRDSKEMKFITQIFNAYTNNQYYRFFHLFETADYMTSCILSLYANRMRLLGLRTIINAGVPKKPSEYPAQVIIDSLGFDDLDDLKLFASTLDINLQQRDDGYFLVLTKDMLPTLRGCESLIKPFRSKRLIEDKARGRSVGQLIDGREELPHNPIGKTISSNISRPLNSGGHDTRLKNFFEAVKSDPPVERTTNRFSWRRQQPSVMDTADITAPHVMDITETPIVNEMSHIESPELSFMDSADIPIEIDEQKIHIANWEEPARKSYHISDDFRLKPQKLANGGHDSAQIRFEPQLGSHRFKRKLADDETKTQKRPVHVREELPREPSRDSHLLDNMLPLDVNNSNLHIESALVAVESEHDKKIQEQSPPKNPEPIVMDANEESELDEVSSPDEPFELHSILYRRVRYKRNQIADMMPVGRYKVRPLARKLPTLNAPPETASPIQSPSCKPTNSPQKSIDLIAAGIEDEVKANVIFSHFIQEFDNNVST